ncbi:Uncharacterized conserved protein, DUF362 family [Sporobacter termitidis DSM 10068]|uniref:Uncharacterized conserved protein, DUF362 family n=1 Tax=Sporobacter termitidis DSM 10068 TaxID=1123282 RepID=A0A1M5XNI2_9FIRM|nr:DUF362 domain-containing protein [Sporobacter termitidis]SHI01405.1 Uncharacterized conserved protein, DUF362 family [Sporobacter termitidis DSM 10068]
MNQKTRIYLVATENRSEGVTRCLSHIGPLDYAGKKVFLKPNFNTADVCPGSTHNDTLEGLLKALRAANPLALTVGDRSGPADTAEVMRQKGIPELCARHGAGLVNFEALDDSGWVKFSRDDLHWPGGYFEYPKVVQDADVVVSTCCLKTHGFGGVFSMSLKLAVGLTPKDFPKLHNTPDMRRMIAEINLAYTPDFIVMDGIDIFTDGGPMDGKRAKAGVMFAGRDRVALDAVGLALLKHLGSNKAIMDTPIFEQEQMRRAAELGLGVTAPDQIDIVADDPKSEALAEKLRAVLKAE